MSSRDRMLAVLRYQEPDHVPLLFNTFGFRPPPHLRWSNDDEEVEAWLSIGLDAMLHVSPPIASHPDVTVREWMEPAEGGEDPCMIKEYDTPAGVLRQEVYRTDDWSSSDWPGHSVDKIRLFDDYNTPRYRKPAIETEDDLAALRYLLDPLPPETLERFRREAAQTAARARDMGVLLVGNGAVGGDAVTWLCGAEGAIQLAVDRPAMFGELMDIIHEWDMRNVEILLDTDVDLIMRRGYYEGTSMWSPALFKRFFQPRLKELVDLAHQADRLIGYTMSVGYMPILDMLAEVGYDAHYLLDPISTDMPVDLARIKSAFANKTAIVGALNEHITLERGTRDQIRREVFDTVSLLGSGGGLALSPAEGIFASTPWHSIETLIEAWREVRDYPLTAA
jgi:hypothetical protein